MNYCNVFVIFSKNKDRAKNKNIHFNNNICVFNIKTSNIDIVNGYFSIINDNIDIVNGNVNIVNLLMSIINDNFGIVICCFTNVI